ncbi:MAG: Fur family transcriptional regulator [Desulfobulbus oligotrophicus]|jgi:Fur family peroxide stress response transcriptional regulator|nr:Fur family transcriptional regulator [Desulfobulbus oligotrophicus]
MTALNDDQLQLQRFEQICKDAGLKVTHQRLEIYREVLAAHDHPSAEALYKRLKKRLPSLSLDTVYRTLGTFDQLNLVHRVETLESQARYEAFNSRHHHFLCKGCGKLVDFTWQYFDAVQLPEHLSSIGTVDQANVVVHGTCAACVSSARSR